MEHFRKILHPPGWGMLLASFSFPALIWIFANGMESALWAYPVYLASAYALTVDGIWLAPRAVLWIRKQTSGKKASMGQNLLHSLWLNLGYAVFQLGMGLFHGSGWLVSNGLYYGMLSLIYRILVTAERKEKDGWRAYTLCGWCLLILNLTMSGMVFQMIWRGEGDSYPGFVVYAVAAYTFYKLVIAIIQLVHSRHNNAPLLGAARNLAHTEALMSLFSLQTALFASFGQEFAYQHLLNTLTGTAVCLLTVLGAVGMIFHGNRRRREAAA